MKENTHQVFILVRLPVLYYITILAIVYGVGCKNKTSNTTINNTRSNSKEMPTSAQVFKKGSAVTDADGNTYTTVIIGKQEWMAENLKVTHYNNGELIPQVTDEKQWRGLTTGAYCNYGNDTSKAMIYGKLYNWHVVTDARKLAPKGWHIPTEAEWKVLVVYLGGDNIASSKLKATGTRYWEAPNSTATNQSGFTALPAGNRNNNGMYENAGFSATWWTATGELQADFATNYSLISNSTAIMQDVDDRVCGLSVRCIKD